MAAPAAFAQAAPPPFVAALEDMAYCDPQVVDLRGGRGRARFAVAVADDPAERAQGLMFVTDMAPDAGMLFVFERPGRVAFWMRNTLIPLDMIFADGEGRVVRVHENAVPGDETPIPGGDAVQYVLEINGGRAAEVGIAAGDLLRHPAIIGAAWPCPAP